MDANLGDYGIFNSDGSAVGIGSDPFAGSGISTASGAGWLSGLTSAVSTIGGAFGSIWKSVNTPSNITLPGGQIYNPQNGTTYTPTSVVTAQTSNVLMFALLGVAALLILRK